MIIHNFKTVAHRIIGRFIYHFWYAPVGYILYSRWEKPEVETLEETMHKLVDEKASICRYGDGEFCVAGGGGYMFSEKFCIVS